MFEVLIFFIFAVIIGLMFLFFGYPFFRILLPIWAFFAGLAFGFTGVEGLLGTGFISVTLALVIGIVIGLVLAVVAYFLYSLAVYLFGITVGYVLGSGLMLAIGFSPGFMSALVGIAVAILFAVLFAMTAMPKLFIILLTAAGGAMAVIMGLFVLFGQMPEIAANLQLTSYLVSGSWFWMLVWIVLAIVGVAFQYSITSMTEGAGYSELSDPYMFEETKSTKKKKK